MVDDGEPYPVRAGDAIYLEVSFLTRSTGWETMRLLAIWQVGRPGCRAAGLPPFQEESTEAG